MTDIVERLRGWPWHSKTGSATRKLCAEAADEIERLRKALRYSLSLLPQDDARWKRYGHLVSTDEDHK